MINHPTPLPAAFYADLAQAALNDVLPAPETALALLTSPAVELLPLLQAAFVVRSHHFGRKVRIHILNNAQNGYCPEDCTYCAQSTSSTAPITRFPLKSDAELIAAAGEAVAAGAYRYCVVLSGRGPTPERIAHLTGVVRAIKAAHPIQVCISAGFIDQGMATALKAAGLDRYNHNLNTAEGLYGSICTTHTYQQRVATLETARAAGLEVCSGIIVGMGEPPEEVVEVATTLRRLHASSIPVNFYVHLEGTRLGAQHHLTPELCLRILCLFRLFNPRAEVRAAGGREVNLRSLNPLALYPANSLFSEGYLNAPGAATSPTIQMIEDAGFEVEQSDQGQPIWN